MIWLVRLYQKIISPNKPPCCRFTPTCSAYAVEAFKKRGFLVGLILTVGRILRCNPLFKGGYDPVPEKGLRNPKNKGIKGEITTTDTQENETNKTEEKDFSND